MSDIIIGSGNRAEIAALVEAQHQAERQAAPRVRSAVETAVHAEVDARGNVTDKTSSGWFTRKSEAGGVIGTARNASGRSLLPHELTPDAVVKAHGFEMTVAQAIENDILRKTSDGRYVEAGAGDPPAPPKDKRNPFEAMQNEEPEQDPNEAQASSDVERSFDTPTEASVSFLNDHVPPQVMTTAIEDVVSGNGISMQAVHDVAKSLNVAPADLQKRISGVYDAYEQQAYKAVEAIGVLPGEGADLAFEWMRQTRPQELQAAIRKHIGERDLSGYRELARLFLQSVRRK